MYLCIQIKNASHGFKLPRMLLHARCRPFRVSIDTQDVVVHSWYRHPKKSKTQLNPQFRPQGKAEAT